LTSDQTLFLGLISGTSCDGIDAAIVSFEPFCVHQAKTFPVPQALRELSLSLGQGQTMVDLDDLGQLDVALGVAFSEAANALIALAGILPTQITAIGSHGQTVRHRPHAKHPFTLQLGCPHVISERTGIKVVADFRRRDVAAGGQGAPLVPAFHAAIFPRTSAVLNLGGIANVTILTDSLLGFDTGPANCLLDAHAQAVFGLTHDAGGKIAAMGKVNGALLLRLLDDPYFRVPPPKSTGREVFNLAWMRARGGNTLENISAPDIQATLLELTAVSIANALKSFQLNELLVCGGGVHCPPLMTRLNTLCGVTVRSTATFGVDPDFVEAAAFAWLARETLARRPGNRPDVTGASGLRVLGAVIG
jgi:anhydro-N-acetylmuramic acid kinase